MRSAAVFDLDGTLCDDAHRKRFVTGDVKFYSMYYSLMDFDKPKPEVMKLLDMCRKQGLAIILLTGRPEKYREITMQWLARHSIHYDLLEMRCDSDFRKSDAMKREVLHKRLKPHYTVILAFDDSDTNIEMFRNNGVEAVRIA